MTTDPVDGGSGEFEMKLVDLGKQSRKKVRRLRKGRGALLDDVRTAVQRLVETEGQSNLPIVVLVREKRKKRRWPGALGW